MIEYKNNPKLGSRKIAQRFNCSKTQINAILKNQAEISKLMKVEMTNQWKQK